MEEERISSINNNLNFILKLNQYDFGVQYNKLDNFLCELRTEIEQTNKYIHLQQIKDNIYKCMNNTTQNEWKQFMNKLRCVRCNNRIFGINSNGIEYLYNDAQSFTIYDTFLLFETDYRTYFFNIQPSLNAFKCLYYEEDKMIKEKFNLMTIDPLEFIYILLGGDMNTI